MILRTFSAVLLSFGIFSTSLEYSFASTPHHKNERKEERGSGRNQKTLVTSMPAPNAAVDLNSSLNGAFIKRTAQDMDGQSAKIDIALPSPSVTVGSKEVLMSPWMPVRSSLGVQMELTW